MGEDQKHRPMENREASRSAASGLETIAVLSIIAEVVWTVIYLGDGYYEPLQIILTIAASILSAVVIWMVFEGAASSLRVNADISEYMEKLQSEIHYKYLDDAAKAKVATNPQPQPDSTPVFVKEPQYEPTPAPAEELNPYAPRRTRRNHMPAENESVEQTFVCPTCGKVLSAGQFQCDGCGTQFVDKV